MFLLCFNSKHEVIQFLAFTRSTILVLTSNSLQKMQHVCGWTCCHRWSLRSSATVFQDCLATQQISKTFNTGGNSNEFYMSNSTCFESLQSIFGGTFADEQTEGEIHLCGIHFCTVTSNQYLLPALPALFTPRLESPGGHIWQDGTLGSWSLPQGFGLRRHLSTKYLLYSQWVSNMKLTIFVLTIPAAL